MAKIIGNTTATTSPQSDYNQTDSTKADYIKNKPVLGTLASKSTVEKSDVASDIQASLNKADTAIQSLEGLATEDYVDNSIGALGGLAGKSTVEKSDLSTDVQESLNKADSALQSFTETDPTVPAWAKADAKPTYTASEVGAVPTSRTVNGKALSANITLSASDVGALPNSTDIPDSLSDLASDTTHRTVTDIEKSTWNAKSNFSGSYNDLTNKPTIPSIAGLATETYVDTKVSGKVDKVDGKGLSTNDYTTADKNKLSGIATGAEVNQNAFSNVVVGTTTIAADGKTDTLTLVAGNNVTLTPDATNDKITIDVAVDAVDEYTLPTAGTSLGGVKTGGDVTISDGIITVNDDSHNHTIANVNGLQTALDNLNNHTSNTTVHITDAERTTWNNKQNKIRFAHDPNEAIYRINNYDLSAKYDLNANEITATYAKKTDLDTLTTTVNGKANSSHIHNYAGSSSAGGAATSANKLNTNAGDSNTPVYFENGVPVACTSLDLDTTGNAATATKATQDGSGNNIVNTYATKNELTNVAQAWTIEENTAQSVTITVADETEYYFPNATTVTINAPSGVTQYECYITIGGANPTISFPASMSCVGVDGREIYSSISSTEISIKDGRYVIGCVGS